MSKALNGEHYCVNHQGNHSHYDPKNCTVCRLRNRLEQAERQRDEAWGLLRELKPLLSYDSGSQLLGHRINAHLPDTED